MILLENVYKQYHRQGNLWSKKDTFWAINNLSLEINRSESVALTGPNGSGKTTLLRIISKITTPTSGLVKLQGKVLPLIGIGGAFSPYLTGRENIYLLSSIFGLRRKTLRGVFDDIIDYSGIKEFLNMQTIRYSSGMMIRLAFAIAIHMPFDIILFDEVLEVGDKDFQQTSLQTIKKFRNEGRTMVFVSHNSLLTHELCDRHIAIAKGKLLKQ
jgi:lipopolysaccharide transport system ATP-binding protein